MIKFNLNCYVRVKLTHFGRDILRRENERWAKKFPDAKWTLPAEDADGWSRWQLWSLMNQLGSYCVLGGPVPFETEIEIDWAEVRHDQK